MRRPLRVIIIFTTLFFSSCSTFYQGSSPAVTTLENPATATSSPQATLPTVTPTLISANQKNCLAIEKTQPADFILDGTIILGASQSIYTFSPGDDDPQPLLGADPSWDFTYSLSSEGKWLAYSILSDDGLRYTKLKIKSLNGDETWEIPYQEDWLDVSGWVSNEQIEMVKSDPQINTTNPYTGTFVINPFTNEISADMDAMKLNLKAATTPYYDPTITRMIYLRDDLIPKSGDPLFESIVIAEISSGKELWVREYPGRDLFLADWSVDGKKVAIQDFSELIVVNLDEGWDKTLRRDDLKLSPSTLPVWSPDGHYVAIKTYNSLAIYDPVNDVLTDYCLHDQVLSFAWSPNSRQLAVGGWLPDNSSYTLIVDVEKNVAVRYTGADFVLLGWTK